MTEPGKGVAAMVLSCVIWGLSPLYYKLLTHIPPLEILAHRVWWSLVFFLFILVLQSRLGALKQALSHGRALGLIMIASVMITVNWFLFIYAVQINHTTETSLGYFIFPLVAVVIGRFWFHEKLGGAQWLSVGLAAVAVAVLTWGLGVTPWISLVLASTFGLYGLIKKGLEIGPVVSVTGEILVLTPIALLVIFWSQMGGTGGFANNWRDSLLLILSGPLTASPLFLFSYAAKRVSMSTVGLLQYINPTLQFLCAVLIFREPFGLWHGIAFALIWLALAIYTISALSQDRTARSASVSSAGVAMTEIRSRKDRSAKP
jgi:chloramphenicol-sensitive protein RarD